LDKIAGLLLTGGAGKRLGRTKANLEFDGATLAHRAAGLLAEVCGTVFEVGPGYTELEAISENPSGAGPLAAVAAGGRVFAERGFRGGVLVLAVDMPFVTSGLLRFIAEFPGKDSAVPIVGGFPQMLCARYSGAAMQTAAELVGVGESAMKALFRQIPVIRIEPEQWSRAAGESAFQDIDTPADLQKALNSSSNSSCFDFGDLDIVSARRNITPADIVCVNSAERSLRSDSLVTEEPMEIRASGPGQSPLQLAVTMRTPGHDFDLAAGFLFTEGLIGPSDIKKIKYCEIPRGQQQYNVVTVKLKRPLHQPPARNFYANSSCGICGKASLDQIAVACPPIGPGAVIKEPAILGMPPALSHAQRVFLRTGGLHAAGLFNLRGELATIREDVGRHNAVDKAIGHMLLSDRLPLSTSALFVSGRLSFEIVQKAAVAGIPIVAAVSAPSSLAVDAAKRLGVTLAGFVRGDKFNIYSHPERIERD